MKDMQTPEAIYNDQAILEITSEVINDLKKRALSLPRRRFRFCLHPSTSDQLQEMLIVAHRDTFIPPHRHPHGKSESYHVIEGTMTVYYFDNEGKVFKKIEMGANPSKKPFLQRLSGNTWHMPVPTSEWVVYHETYPGPFEKEYDVEFPPWAPAEENKEEVQRFLNGLRITDSG